MRKSIADDADELPDTDSVSTTDLMGPSPSDLSLSQRTKTILGFGASFKKMGCLRLKKERGERVGRVRIGGRVQWVGALTVIVVVVGCCDFLLVAIEKRDLGVRLRCGLFIRGKKGVSPGFVGLSSCLERSCSLQLLLCSASSWSWSHDTTKDMSVSLTRSHAYKRTRS